MNKVKQEKKGPGKIKNLPGRPRSKLKKTKELNRFNLDISDFKKLNFVSSDSMLRKRCPNYFAKCPRVTLSRLSTNNVNNQSRNAFDIFDSNMQGLDNIKLLSPENIESKVRSDLLTETEKSTVKSTNTSRKIQEGNASEKTQTRENQIALSNNIVTELDVTNLKLTFKNLINHKSSSATGGDEISSCEHSGEKMQPVLSSDEITITDKTEDINIIYDDNQNKNAGKENDSCLSEKQNNNNATRVLSNDTSFSETYGNYSKDNIINQSDTLVNLQEEKQSETNQNCEQPTLSEIVTNAASQTVHSSPPPVLLAVNSVDTSSKIKDVPYMCANSKVDEELPKTNATKLQSDEQISEIELNQEEVDTDLQCTTLNIYVVEENISRGQDTATEAIVPLEKDPDKGRAKSNDVSDERTECCMQVGVENQPGSTSNTNEEISSSSVCHLEEPPKRSLPKPPKNDKKQTIIKKEHEEIILRKPLYQHDGYDSDATMIYDEEEDKSARIVSRKGSECNPLKIKQTQQLLRLKSKIEQSAENRHEIVKTPETMECIESLYPTFRGENLDNSDDLSNKTSSDIDENHLYIAEPCETADDVNSVSKIREYNSDKKKEKHFKPINKIRIALKQKDKKHEHSKYHIQNKEKHNGGIKLAANKWEEVITSCDAVIVTDLTISRGIAKKHSEKTNKKNKSTSPKTKKTERKRKHDTQDDMVLKNINKIFPKPRRKRTKDEDDLPKILPPKRRRQEKGHLIVDSKSDMDRIKQEFPQFNWLEKKYRDQNKDDKKDSDGLDISNIEKTLDICNSENIYPPETTLQDINKNPQETTQQNEKSSLSESTQQNEKSSPSESTQQYLNSAVEGNDKTVFSNIEDNDQIQFDNSRPRHANNNENSDENSTTESISHAESNTDVQMTVNENEVADSEVTSVVMNEEIENVEADVESVEVHSITTTSVPSCYIESEICLEDTMDQSHHTITTEPSNDSDKGYENTFHMNDDAFSGSINLIMQSEETIVGSPSNLLKQNNDETLNTNDVHANSKEVERSSIPTNESCGMDITKEAINANVSNISESMQQLEPTIPTTSVVISTAALGVTKNTNSTHSFATSCSEELSKHSKDLSTEPLSHSSASAQIPTDSSNTVSSCISTCHSVDSCVASRYSPSVENNQIQENIQDNIATLEPVNKKQRTSEITSIKTKDYHKNIPPLVPVSSVTKPNKPIFSKSRLLGPEVEATYNDIKQLKHELEMRNREAGQMMMLLKEKEEMLRNLLLSSPLGPNKRPIPASGINLTNRVNVSSNDGQLQVIQSSCKAAASKIFTSSGQKNKVPPPAHSCKKEDTKEILRTLEINSITVPHDIRATGPFSSRQRPLSPPTRFKGASMPGPLTAAHAQKPFEVPGKLITVKNERSKSQGSEVTSISDTSTSRAVSAPARDSHLCSPINLQQQFGNPCNLTTNSTIQTSFQSAISPTQVQPHVVTTPQTRPQRMISSTPATKQTKTSAKGNKNTESAIQQELSEAIRRRQNQERLEQDYQQFKITKPPMMNNTQKPNAITKPSFPDTNNFEMHKHKLISENGPGIVPAARSSMHTISKSGNPPQYAGGQLLTVLQRSPHHGEANGRPNNPVSSTRPSINPAHLPHSVRLIGAATVPSNQIIRGNDPRRTIPTLYQTPQMHYQLSPVAVSNNAPRAQNIHMQPGMISPNAMSHRGYHEGPKSFHSPPAQFQAAQNIQNHQILVPVSAHQQMVHQTPESAARFQQVHQAKLQQTIQQQQENCSPDMLNVKAQGMIPNSQVVQGSGMPQQEAGSKAQHIFGNCIMCGKFSLYLCSTCQSIWYCSQQCQLKHWTTHQHECKYTTTK
ncbi:uncharacterized protein LOC127711835 isoform X2 [Mytilus californianus]|uniref:uncharacterized protein LOC127711835 isoform X2 n=1 Tax=Mytilus californianus TaxID=6549 RepID=UPI0022464B70|nr:uncharacterized protein LOC127711835 isoform X2 [Mytilus californianus]